MFQSRNHKGALNDIGIAPSAPLLATASNHQLVIWKPLNLYMLFFIPHSLYNRIKLHEFQDMQSMYGMVEIEDLKGIVIYSAM